MNTTIATTTLGTNGPTVGMQGLGCMGMSAFYGPSDDRASRATLEAALERGVTMFDTADMYGNGANEEFLSPFFRAHRDRVFLATKFGIRQRSTDVMDREIKGDRNYVRHAAEESLRRLGTDHIDLYYMHRRDVNTPLEETIEAMAELVKEGKVSHLGLSEVTAAEIEQAHAIHPIAAVQSEWSLFSRDIETNVVPTAAGLGIALVPYSPLGRGFLTGAFSDATKELADNDVRRRMARFVGDNAQANAALVAPIREVAQAHEVSLAEVALAWVHSRAAAHQLPVVPIPGTRSVERLHQNLAATDLTLSDSDLAKLEGIADHVAGLRYPAGSGFSSQDRE
ncbi:aldo/keto reductase [Natronoglycomyces albus]|uniref:Aldo/keto reductase n=1 Tax=Natronoglycomyces albus TaxID=2811108 RepID=A0A895XNZ3_9ACTN|nr:aldo/keto reductase [Natronoglycomyces albus]QSB06857.1 aldo/keto reductase [Natronoglycomyces albus]